MRVNHRRIILALIALALCLSGVSYAWFVQEQETELGLEMGYLDLALDFDPLVEDETEFTVTNTGNLEVYVRLGCTFVYTDGDGRELLDDVSGLSLDSGSGTLRADRNATPLSLEITEMASGYDYTRELLFVLNDGRQYYRLAPGESLTGQFTILGAESGSDRQLNAIWVAEALQCNVGALENGVAYGWNPALA